MSDDDIQRMKMRILEELRQELREGTRKEAQRTENDPTVREMFERWEADDPPRKDWVFVRSAKGRLLDMEVTINGRTTKLGDLPYSRCDHLAAQAWRAKRKQQRTIRIDRRTGEKKLTSPRTRDRELSVLQSMFSHHLEAKSITVNPLAGLSEEGGKEGERQGAYSDEQFALLLHHSHPLFAKMARLSHVCGGMRSDEVRRLNDAEIDWDNGLIILKADRNKNEEARTIPLTQEIYDMLCALREAAPMHPSGVRYLFPNPRSPRGEPVPRATMYTWLVKARDAAGITLTGELPTFHHLRHTWAKNALDRGAPVPWVMDVAGWKSVEVAKKYMKLSGNKIERMRELMSTPIAPVTKALKTPRKSPQGRFPRVGENKKFDRDNDK